MVYKCALNNLPDSKPSIAYNSRIITDLILIHPFLTLLGKSLNPEVICRCIVSWINGLIDNYLPVSHSLS